MQALAYRRRRGARTCACMHACGALHARPRIVLRANGPACYGCGQFSCACACRCCGEELGRHVCGWATCMCVHAWEAETTPPVAAAGMHRGCLLPICIQTRTRLWCVSRNVCGHDMPWCPNLRQPALCALGVYGTSSASVGRPQNPSPRPGRLHACHHHAGADRMRYTGTPSRSGSSDTLSDVRCFDSSKAMPWQNSSCTWKEERSSVQAFSAN
jgi:hypothetical protein